MLSAELPLDRRVLFFKEIWCIKKMAVVPSLPVWNVLFVKWKEISLAKIKIPLETQAGNINLFLYSIEIF